MKKNQQSPQVKDWLSQVPKVADFMQITLGPFGLHWNPLLTRSFANAIACSPESTEQPVLQVYKLVLEFGDAENEQTSSHTPNTDVKKANKKKIVTVNLYICIEYLIIK